MGQLQQLQQPQLRSLHVRMRKKGGLRKKERLKDFRNPGSNVVPDPTAFPTTPIPTAAPTQVVPDPTASPTTPIPTAAPTQGPTFPSLPGVEVPPTDGTVTDTCDNGNRIFQVDVTVEGAGGVGGTRTVPVEIVFALDSSGSMVDNDPENLRLSAASQLLGRLNPATDIAGVVSWDDNIDFVTVLTSNYANVNAGICAVDSSSLNTDLDVGLDRSVSLLEPDSTATEVIVFLTDGAGSYTNCNSLGPAATARDNGFRIYSVGLGNANTAPLIDMANCTGGAFFDSPSAVNLDAIFTEIFDEVLISTIPVSVSLTLTLEPGFELVPGSDTPPADTLTRNSAGQTTLIWANVDNGQGLGTGESFDVSFDVTASSSGELTSRVGSNISFTNLSLSVRRIEATSSIHASKSPTLAQLS